MPVKILTIPFDAGTESFDDSVLRDFLSNKRAKRIIPFFFINHGKPYWSFFVEYDTVFIPGENAVPEGRKLDEAQRLLFERLRNWRSERARVEGVPVFIIATNRQLLEITQKKPETIQGLGMIRGFGKKKLERYGREILHIIHAFYKPNKTEYNEQEPREEGK